MNINQWADWLEYSRWLLNMRHPYGSILPMLLILLNIHVNDNQYIFNIAFPILQSQWLHGWNLSLFASRWLYLSGTIAAAPGHSETRALRGSFRTLLFHNDWPQSMSMIAIWKPIPVRIFYRFVIYQGYDMDILSGKSYDVIYQGYDMDIPNANNLELHILVIYFLTFKFGQIF